MKNQGFKIIPYCTYGAIALPLILSAGFGAYFAVRAVPEQKIQAAATDRANRIILATGYVSGELEAIYSLDQSTGRLAAGILSRREGVFQGLYERNVNEDLAEVIQGKYPNLSFPVAPQYTMVSGELNSENRGGSRWRVSKAVVYLGEVNTGIIMVYTIPWEPTLHSADTPITGQLEFWAAEQFQPAITPALSPPVR